jgi:hypothetical protein
MQPILDGELYRIMNDFYNRWNIEPIIDNLNSIINETKKTLIEQVNKRDERLQIKEEILNRQMESDAQAMDDMYKEGKELGIYKKEEEEENTIKIDEDGNITI